MEAKIFDGKEAKDAPIPDNMIDEVEPIRTMLIEAAVETSEELMEKYFEGEEITEEELTNAIAMVF